MLLNIKNYYNNLYTTSYDNFLDSELKYYSKKGGFFSINYQYYDKYIRDGFKAMDYDNVILKENPGNFGLKIYSLYVFVKKHFKNFKDYDNFLKTNNGKLYKLGLKKYQNLKNN